eukprot:scaffold480581_cov47-Prasinocladus_malaysianus.AAC.1
MSWWLSCPRDGSQRDRSEQPTADPSGNLYQCWQHHLPAIGREIQRKGEPAMRVSTADGLESRAGCQCYAACRDLLAMDCITAKHTERHCTYAPEHSFQRLRVFAARQGQGFMCAW